MEKTSNRLKYPIQLDKETKKQFDLALINSEFSNSCELIAWLLNEYGYPQPEEEEGRKVR